MRLSQIARKLGVAPSTVGEILIENGYEAPKNGNTKLNEDQVSDLYKHFNITVFTEPEVLKELEKEEEQESKVLNEQVSDESKAEEINELETDNPLIQEDEAHETSIDEAIETALGSINKEEEEVEVIRAKKIKLDGIKVVGKINLPEPKEKKAPEIEDTEGDKQPELKKRERNFKRKRGQHNRKKRTLTFEEKQAAEERKRLRAKRERERKLKAKKQAYFQQNIQPKQKEAAIVAKRKKKKKEQTKTAIPQRTKITTKNPFKRFWLWLNDPYA